MLYYKFFTTRFGSDPINSIEKLRIAFPKCFYRKGRYKGASGIFVINDLDNRKYGESWELDNNDVFWGISDKPSATKDLEKYKTESTDRIPVLLACGIVLQIYPATAIPRKVYFTRKQTVDDCPYNRNVEYGQLAYEMYDRSKQQKQIAPDDPQFLKFIKLVLTSSYCLPMEAFDSLEIISAEDIEKIFAAGMGFEWEYLKKTYEESKQQCSIDTKSL